MRKIDTLFVREGRLVTPAVTPGCEWVLDNVGVATRKYDGTCCLVRAEDDGPKLYRRLVWDAAKGPAPAVWHHYDFNPEQRSGHGWFPVGDGPDDWMHRLAKLPPYAGTYELCGPKIQKNAEGYSEYTLVYHGAVRLDAPRTFEGLRDWLKGQDIEGIVWHAADGRMAKIKLRDFGYHRESKNV